MNFTKTVDQISDLLNDLQSAYHDLEVEKYAAELTIAELEKELDHKDDVINNLNYELEKALNGIS